MNMERPINGGGEGLEVDPRPIVVLPASGVGAGAIAAGCITLAAILFLALNQQRLARERPAMTGPSAPQMASPPPLALPPTEWPPQSPLLAAEPSLSVAARIPPLPQTTLPQSRPLTWRQTHPVVIEQWTPPNADPASPVPPPMTAWQQPDQTAAAPVSSNGPAIVQDNGETREWSGLPAGISANGIGTAADHPAGSQDKARTAPRAIGDVTQVVAVGTMIEAVLETPVDSSRPGMTRAIVSRAVRSFDGSRVLIPRGSRLVGEFGGQAQGANRLLIRWTQVILPNGISLDINSPGADASGQAGLDAQSHGGVGRFIGGILQSAITAGATLLAARPSVYYAVPLAGTAPQMVPRSSGGKRLTVAAGAQINVVVARTLDFSDAM